MHLVLDEHLLEEVARISGEATYSRAVTRAIEDSETVGASNDDSSSLH
jgi:hypothetical protein